jgi:hypothetical protein
VRVFSLRVFSFPVFSFLLDMGGGLCSACLFLPEGMVQQAGGHADLPVRSHLTQLQVESAYPYFLSPAHATSG